MSDEPTGEKTEEPTEKKIRDAREKGQVAKSTDVSSTWLLIINFSYFAIFKNFYVQHAKNILVLPSYFYEEAFGDALATVLVAVILEFIILTIPLLVLVAINAIFINMVQIGPLLTFEPLKPDIKKINPVDGFKKIFSKKNLVEFIKSILKMAFLGYLLYRVIRNAITPLLLSPFAGINGVLAVIGPIFKTFTINVCVAYVIIAVADLFMQRVFHTKELRMTKDEVKREFKEMEGDPLIKGERKQLHQEMVMNDTVQSTKKSSVLVTNPTHFAIAIFYEKDVLKLPVIIAKGQDHVARIMIEIARESDIPIMQDPSLAQALHAQVEVWNYIPKHLIDPVAKVLRWVHELKKERTEIV